MECELKCFVTSAVPFFHNESFGMFDFAGGMYLCIRGVTLNRGKRTVAGIGEKAPQNMHFTEPSSPVLFHQHCSYSKGAEGERSTSEELFQDFLYETILNQNQSGWLCCNRCSPGDLYNSLPVIILAVGPLGRVKPCHLNRHCRN